MSEPEIADNVELESVDKLIPYSNNPKEHPDEQVKKIASSIKNYGWDQPIVVDGDNEIIKGHGRVQAAELLGLGEVPIIRREDLTYAEARAARIADNKTAEGQWDDELLSMELDILDDTDPIDIDSLGFDENELEDLLTEMEVPDFDPVPESEQSDLDDTDRIECPECGHEWTPGF